MSYINRTITGGNILPNITSGGTGGDVTLNTYSSPIIKSYDRCESMINDLIANPELLEKLFKALIDSGIYKKVIFEKELKEIINAKD